MRKKCRICKSAFEPTQPFQTWCCPDHGFLIASAKLGKIKKAAQTKERRAQKVAKVKERQADQVTRERLKTRSDYIKETQIAFNGYIRERDKEKPCICCGMPLIAGDVGGKFDCGHYRSVGSAPHLRFVENNAHGQRKQCNRWGAGRAVDYRLGLIARIGLEAVDVLESDQAPRRYTIDDLKAIKADYTAKTKQLKESQS